ncbi:hypothetical protein Mycsm_00754 [Mycobacterium sp. JS623]|nr:hypothetical protein Mycsm_00754 [Mycobacterium sp. JS623]
MDLYLAYSSSNSAASSAWSWTAIVVVGFAVGWLATGANREMSRNWGPSEVPSSRTPSRPELIDAPHYMLEVELHFPNLAPVTGRDVQPVPMAHVPTLGIGLPLTCAVDPADPSRRFVVDWDAPLPVELRQTGYVPATGRKELGWRAISLLGADPWRSVRRADTPR